MTLAHDIGPDLPQIVEDLLLGLVYALAFILILVLILSIPEMLRWWAKKRGRPWD